MTTRSSTALTKQDVQRIFNGELTLAEFDEIARKNGFRRNGGWDVEANSLSLTPLCTNLSELQADREARHGT